MCEKLGKVTLEEVICESKQSYGVHLAAESVAPASSLGPAPQRLISRSKYHSSHLRCSQLHISPAQKIVATHNSPVAVALLSARTVSLFHCNWLIYLKLSLSPTTQSTEQLQIWPFSIFQPNQTIYIHIVQNTVISMMSWKPLFFLHATKCFNTLLFLNYYYCAQKNTTEKECESLIVLK